MYDTSHRHRDVDVTILLNAAADGAKATASTIPEKMPFTEHPPPIGTPESMSPEQAAGNRDIDTRTDRLLPGCAAV